MRRLIAIVAFLICASIADAQVRLAGIFGDGMVLQQNSTVEFYGTARPRSSVRVDVPWLKRKLSVQAGPDGNWSIYVTTPEASFTEYTLTFSDGKSKLSLSDVLVGEVWLCSGQSNMSMPLAGSGGQPVWGSYREIASSSGYGTIRFLRVKPTSCSTPADEIEGEWCKICPQTAALCSAAAYFFAKNLTDLLHVPIGLILASWGGSFIEGWIDAADMELLRPELSRPDIAFSRTKDNAVPGGMFNGMIAPLRKAVFKGVLWYQGESNRDNPCDYDELLCGLVSSWRRHWNDVGCKLPFYIVQITPYHYSSSELLEMPLVVEAQYKAQSTIPNSSMIPTTDIGCEACLHSPDKSSVGERAAFIAGCRTYGLDYLPGNVPQYKEIISISGSKVLIGIANVMGDPDCPDCSLSLAAFYDEGVKGFEIAGEDRVFHPAEAKVLLRKNEIRVWSDAVRKPVAVRYSFHNYSPGNVRNTAGFPLPPFRTDSWDDATYEKQ